MTDDPNLSELLDDDKLPEEFPPEEPLGVEDPGVTADHGAVGDSVAERAAREVPEVSAAPSADDGAVGHLLAPDEGSAPDTEEDMVASAVPDDDLPGGAAPGDQPVGTESFDDIATERVDDRSAEELAVHVTSDPPFDPDDSYLDDEPPVDDAPPGSGDVTPGDDVAPA